MQAKSHEYWMSMALEMAQQAASEGETPIGAVLLKDDCVLAKAYNQSIQNHDPTAHAEIQALRSACQVLQNYRLPGVRLYVTLQPCMMCAGAIVHARVAQLVFGAYDTKSGATDHCQQWLERPQLNHRVMVTGGVMAEACSALLKDFFRQRR